VRKLKLNHTHPIESFSNLIWLVGETPKEVIILAKQNKLTCVCYLPNTPIESCVYFHIKSIIHA